MNGLRRLEPRSYTVHQTATEFEALGPLGMFDKFANPLNIQPMARRISKLATTEPFPAQDRHGKVMASAGEAGLLEGVRSAIGARVPQPLIDAAREKTGLTSMTEIVEYALAKVALEDDFGVKLVARKGRIPKDIDLEF